MLYILSPPHGHTINVPVQWDITGWIYSYDDHIQRKDSWNVLTEIKRKYDDSDNQNTECNDAVGSGNSIRDA